MLTKKLTFSDEVMSILSSMKWENDGKLGILTCGQLDRKMYVDVNKALDAMGGKWNRSKGGHVFPVDPRSSVEGLLSSGSLLVERDGFFETPIEVVHRITEIIVPTGNVLEPSAGLGAIADHLPILQNRVFCIEKNEQRAKMLIDKGYTVYCGDFLEYNHKDKRFDTIFMNPPFEEGQDIDHVKHAFSLLRVGGSMISVMSEGVFFRSDRKATSFREWMANLGFENEKLPDGSFDKSGTGVNTRLVWYIGSK